ncbi:MAG: hypothetical protein HY268_13980 [Deltaproteobacteria bacterium]|nr:hypothetical protein [Deltaproteobacteria bacterium]
MAESFEDRYLDVLQNIESAIVETYREYPELSDRQVRDVVEVLVRSYEVEARGYALPAPKFSSPTKELYENVRSMCNWRLGKEALLDERGQSPAVEANPKTIKEIIACLKRIRLSIKTRKGEGRRGYLDFVSQFVS